MCVGKKWRHFRDLLGNSNCHDLGHCPADGSVLISIDEWDGRAPIFVCICGACTRNRDEPSSICVNAPGVWIILKFH